MLNKVLNLTRAQQGVKGLAQGNDANLEITTRNIIKQISLLFSDGTNLLTVAEMKSQITRLIGHINGTVIRDTNATYELMLQQYYLAKYGVANQNGILPISFYREEFESEMERDVYSLGMGGIDTFTFDISCQDDAAFDASIGKCYVKQKNATRAFGQHIRHLQHSLTHTTADDMEVTTLPKTGSKRAYKAIHIEVDPSTIDSISLIQNDESIIHEIPPSILHEEAKNAGRTPQTGWTHIDFDTNNDLMGYLWLHGTTDLNLKIGFNTAPNTFKIYTEVIHDLAIPA